MSQEVKSLNFAAEANYTIRLCKEIVAYHYPDKMPLGSFELVASNKVRSDEETLAEAELNARIRAQNRVVLCQKH